MDDSTNFQVYNNTLTFDSTDTAVNETFGQLLEYNGDPIERSITPHLTGMEPTEVCGERMRPTRRTSGSHDQQQGEEAGSDIQRGFESFIKDENTDAYDSDFPMFRWNTKTTSTILDEKIGGVGRITGLTITSRGAGEYAKTLKVVGTEGSKTFSGRAGSAAFSEMYHLYTTGKTVPHLRDGIRFPAVSSISRTTEPMKIR